MIKFKFDKKAGYSNNPNYFGDWFGKGQIDYSQVINPNEEGDLYLVKIWGGKGYILDVYLVNATDFQSAIDKVFEWSYHNEGENKIIFDYGYLLEQCREDYESETWYGYGEGKPSDKMSFEDFETEWFDTQFISNEDFSLFARSENFFVDKVPAEKLEKQASKKSASLKRKAGTGNFATQEGYPLIAIGEEQVYPKQVFVETWNDFNPDEPITKWTEREDYYYNDLSIHYDDRIQEMKDYLENAYIPSGWDITFKDGYYEGIQLWVNEPDDFEYDFENNWLYDNDLDESDLTPEQKAELQNAMQAQYEKEKAQVIQIMHDAAKANGWLELEVAYRFSNGETGYSVVK